MVKAKKPVVTNKGAKYIHALEAIVKGTYIKGRVNNVSTGSNCCIYSYHLFNSLYYINNSKVDE